MSTKRKIRGKLLKLYEQIPSGFQCKPECGKCCQDTIVMMKDEWEHMLSTSQHLVPESRTTKVLTSAAEHEREMVMIVDDRGWCPFLDEKGHLCMAFEHRPYVCRQYGQHWTLGCQEGVVCPPELEIPDSVYHGYAAMFMPGLPMKGKEQQAFFRRMVEWWRKKFNLRPDSMPMIDNAQACVDLYAAATGDHP